MIEEFPIPLPFGPLNQRDDQYIIGNRTPGALVNLENMDYYEGGLKTRDGYISYNSALSAKPILNLYSYNKKNGGKMLLAVCGTSIYRENTAPGSFSSIKGNIVDGNVWDFQTLSDLAIGVDGVSADAIKYDGVTVYPYRITPPSGPPIVAVGVTGSITGTYSYKVTFVSKWGAETNASTLSASVTVNNQTISLSSIPIGNADIAERRLYRTLNNGTVYYLLTSITNNTTATYEDNTIDTQIGTDLTPVNHDQPPSDLAILSEWKQFMWGVRISEPMRIYFSHQRYPEIYNTDEVLGYYVEVGGDNGENIIGMHKLQAVFFAFKENSTWPIVGETPDDFKVAPEPINGAIGLYHRSIDKMPSGQLIGLHRSGVYLFDGYRFESLTDRAEDSIQPLIDNLNPNRLQYARGFVDKSHKRYILTVSESGYSYNNKALVYDYLRNRWSKYDIKANDLIIWNDSILFGSSQPDGLINKLGGTSDNGTAISVKAEWPWWGLWDPATLKTIRYLMVDTTQWGTYEPTITAYVDGRVVAIPVTREERALWGSGQWLLDGGTYHIKKLLRIDKKGANALKLKFTHSGLNEPVTIAGLTVYGYVSDMVAVR